MADHQTPRELGEALPCGGCGHRCHMRPHGSGQRCARCDVYRAARVNEANGARLLRWMIYEAGGRCWAPLPPPVRQ